MIRNMTSRKRKKKQRRRSTKGPVVLNMALSVILILFCASIVQNVVKLYAGKGPLRSDIRVEILNGCGERNAATAMRSTLLDRGYNVVRFGNARQFNFERTLIVNRGGRPDLSEMVARDLGCRSRITQIDTTQYIDVILILGRDYDNYLSTDGYH